MSKAQSQAASVTTEGLPRALASGTRPPRAGALSACLTFAWRGVLKIRHVPEQLIDATFGPILLLVTFTYLFGGAIAGSTDDYLQFLLPGILVQAVLFTAVYSGVALNADMTKSVVDRFRTLPIWRPAPLIGAVLGDAVRYALAATVVIVVGLIMGFDADGGISGLLAGGLLVVVFAFALSWLFTTAGLLLRSSSAVQGGGMTFIFLFVFLSNVFVDPDTLPTILEAVVRANPISHLVTAVRGLFAGEGSAGDIALVIAEAAVLTAVFGSLTARLYWKK
jgi:ABC-2 type transport system permease protein